MAQAIGVQPGKAIADPTRSNQGLTIAMQSLRTAVTRTRHGVLATANGSATGAGGGVVEMVETGENRTPRPEKGRPEALQACPAVGSRPVGRRRPGVTGQSR